MSDKAVRSGINIPNFTRRNQEANGFDPSALSPPAYEDDFFQIRQLNLFNTRPTTTNPSSNLANSNNQYKSLSEVLTEQPTTLANHTSPCKQFLPQVNNNLHQTARVTKPMGVDDGFKGPAAACGSSIVAMAQQMMRGKTVDDAIQPKYNRQRRNSKSLPASPLGSPESRRRVQNRFFTGGDLLSTFFAAAPHTEDQALSTSPQPDHVDHSHQTPAGEVNIKLDVAVQKQVSQTFRPKPSELREMNFWSPTSL